MINKISSVIDSNDSKIESLKNEFEKRNPTDIEKLSLRSKDSYPFNVSPVKYWDDKEENSNYSTDEDNEEKEYVITSDDISNDRNWKRIADTIMQECKLSIKDILK